MILKKIVMAGCLFSFLALSVLSVAEAQPASSALDNLAAFKSYQSKRISSFNPTGENADRIAIEPGETAEIARIEGAGIIKHIWITINCIDPMLRRNAILRMYWDGEESASVECPIGDFFGQGWGEAYPLVSLPLAVAPNESKGLNCYFPMPFSDGALITVENQSEKRIRAFFFYIDYEEHESLSPDMGRFHAFWNRELTDPLPEEKNDWNSHYSRAANRDGLRNYVIVNIEGKGHFVGVNYYVDNPSPVWYGEGDDMFFIDGEEWPPSLHGTGTEDFFNSSWCPKVVYMHPYFGYARVNDSIGWMGRTHCYRFFLESPVAFEKSLLATIEHGHNNSQIMDLVTVAYWYQQEPHKPFPKIRPKEERQNMPAIRPPHIHRWRDAWRKEQGVQKLWGNERKKEKNEP